MALEEKRMAEPAREPDVLLAMKAADGTVTSIGPMSRLRAEALVQVYSRAYPDGTCWVEPLRPEIEALHVGRVRRVGRSKRKGASTDH